MQAANWTPPFDEMERHGAHDIFCPFGGNKMVLMDGLTDGEHDEDEDETDVRVQNIAPENLDFPAVDPELAFEPDAEDLAGVELANRDVESKKHEAFIIVDADTGGNTLQHRSTVLRIYSNNDPNSTDRLKRVQNYSRFDQAGRGLGVGLSIDREEPTFSIHDPAAMLVRCKNLIWLAVVQIVDLQLDGSGAQELPTRLLDQSSTLRIKVQVMRLGPVQQDGNSEGDWEWIGRFETLPGTTSTCNVEGGWLQLVNPTVVPPTRPGNTSLTTYQFKSSEVVAIANLLYERLKTELDHLPSIPLSNTFPYRTNDGV
jgi:hypothetical protein